MSSIVTPPKGPAIRVLNVEPKPSPPSTHQDATRHSDAEMMYAWSIGVATLDREKANDSQQHAYEECPPEVYIG